MFFSFDGLDGVGKSTQLELFCDWLRERGNRVVTCRDPGSTPLGDRIREILLHSEADTPIASRAEMLLYMAARAQLVDEVIRPALERGETVVSDRFLLANLVYQGHAAGVSLDDLRSVGTIAIDGVIPTRVIVLDLPPEEADNRIQGPRDRMESRGEAYRQRLREGFLAEAAADPDRIAVIDAAGSIFEVHQRIRKLVGPLFD